MLDGRHTGHRRRQPRHARRRDAGRQPAAAPPRPAAQPDHLLAEPSGAVVSVLRHVHRPDQPGAARRRSARRPPLRARDRVPAAGRASTSAGRTNRSPWLVDRLLRHLLTDLTGNTHRAEFSIDKLYSPDAPTGRLGLLEFRAFEMPPHCADERACRCCCCARWSRASGSEPYRGRLVRWGTALHDRWLLPHFVAADMRDVVARPRRVRLPRSSATWFAPFVEFRFPALRHRRLRRRRRSSCARRSSPGTCWARRSAAPAPRAMSIRRSSACRSR